MGGAAKVTTTPGTGLLPASFTVTCNVEANAVLIVALCGVPPVAVSEFADPVRLLSRKLAASAPDVAVAGVVDVTPTVGGAGAVVAATDPREVGVAAAAQTRVVEAGAAATPEAAR